VTPSFNEAWIFASLKDDGSPTTLAELIAAADMLNHAIPTAAEVRSALAWLASRGWVVPEGEAIALTPRGREVAASGRGRRGGLFAIADNMGKAMRSPRFRNDPVVAAPPAFPFVTDAAVTRACGNGAAK
jgi:hypothetical protein